MPALDTCTCFDQSCEEELCSCPTKEEAEGIEEEEGGSWCYCAEIKCFYGERGREREREGERQKEKREREGEVERERDGFVL